jgi:hypothetical protein
MFQAEQFNQNFKVLKVKSKRKDSLNHFGMLHSTKLIVSYPQEFKIQQNCLH